MEEEWRDVIDNDFMGLYQVSNLGRVRTIDRYSQKGGENPKLIKSHLLTIGKYSNGYLMVGFSYGKHRGSRLVHRLVAQAFIPNPDNLPQVNHKDEDITNNRVDNLEWCTPSYNANYGTRNARCYESNRKHFKPVYQIAVDCGMVIRCWDSISNAAKTLNICEEQISRVCKGTNKTAGGFFWKYAERDAI